MPYFRQKTRCIVRGMGSKGHHQSCGEISEGTEILGSKKRYETPQPCT